jgi:hypothetical protein
MMTGIECLNMLSYKVQVQFLKNLASQGKTISDILSSEFHNVSEFVSGNFFWDDTPEGSDYWIDIAEIFR